MKILPVGTELFYVDIGRKGRTDRHTDRQTVRHDEANRHFTHSFKIWIYKKLSVKNTLY
jgi:hypothetical protein